MSKSSSKGLPSLRFVSERMQVDQELVVSSDVEHAPLVGAAMEAGWRAGASDGREDCR